MFYFVNIQEKSGYTCTDDDWIYALTIAKRSGWNPEGTKYDFAYAIVEDSDDYNIMSQLFSLININNRLWEWQGSYTEKENQVVSDTDAASLYQVLIKSPGEVPGDLLRFIVLGSFRILDT